MKKIGLVILSFVAFALIASYAAASERGVARITASEIKARLDKGEKIAIVDARTGGSYITSPWRIKGDIRLEPEDVSAKAKTLPRGAMIVTYCT